MDKNYTPKQMATRLHVSTTTLRRYEELDLVPDVPRTSSNRRYYTPLHAQAFIALRALIKGFEIPVSYDVMSLLKKGHVEQALWTINLHQYHIQIEKQRVEEIMGLIQKNRFHQVQKRTCNGRNENRRSGRDCWCKPLRHPPLGKGGAYSLQKEPGKRVSGLYVRGIKKDHRTEQSKENRIFYRKYEAAACRFRDI